MFFRLLLTGILAATLASAQRGGGGRSGASNAPVMMGNQSDKLTILSDNLKLTKDQKKLVRTVLDEGQKEAAPLRDQVAKGRQAIGEAVSAGKTQNEIDQLVQSHAAIESQMAGIEIRAFVKIYRELDKDQQTRAQILFQMMNGMFKGKNWND